MSETPPDVSTQDSLTCPDSCFNQDGKPHLAPVVEWIGDMPIIHGERDVPYGDPEQCYCLCGHHPYYTCPESDTGGITTMVIGDPYGGRLSESARDAGGGT